MSGRIFQNVVLQLKENTDRTVGVIDGEGVVIACSELSMIGQRWSEYVAAANGAAGIADAGDGCNGRNYSHSKKEKINEQESN